MSGFKLNNMSKTKFEKCPRTAILYTTDLVWPTQLCSQNYDYENGDKRTTDLEIRVRTLVSKRPITKPELGTRLGLQKIVREGNGTIKKKCEQKVH